MMSASLSRLSNEERCRLEKLLIAFDYSWTVLALSDWAQQLVVESPEYRGAALLELVKIDLEYRHRHGPQRIERYFRQFPELKESQDMVCELLEAELNLRAEEGAVGTHATEDSLRPPRMSDTRTHGDTNGASDVPELPCDFGRYRLLSVLGRGSMGVVYLAEEKELQRTVALKRPRIGDGNEDTMLARFYQEAYASASLNHPNICPVYHMDRIDGIPFIAMALVEGDTLAATLRRRSWDPIEAAVLIRKVALALAEAHRHGIVHRDLKASNIMVHHRDEPVVMDFGLAYRFESEASRETVPGTLIGTPAYASPEQLASDGREVGPVSDIYSLGVVFFELLTGSLPFRGSLGDLVAKILRDPAPAPSLLREGLPSSFDNVCLRMLAKSPADRHASMAEVAESLRELIESRELNTSPPVEAHEVRSAGIFSRRGVWLGGISAGVLGVVVLASQFALQDLQPDPQRKNRVSPVPEPHLAGATVDRHSASELVQPPENSQPREVWTCRTLGTGLRWCPPGRFRMGSSSESARKPNEVPVEVTLTQGLWVSPYEITQRQWREIMGTEPWKNFEDHREGPNYAASHVTWFEAVAFCREVTKRERSAGTIRDGWELRLPTEAEWEYFARAGTSTRYSFGDESSRLSEYAWWRDNAEQLGDKYAHEVGRLKPNPWDLFDIHGNVYEWCQDTYSARLPGGTDPLLITPGDSQRVNRGGGWDFRDEWAHTSSNRRWTAADERRNNLGLRVIMGRVLPDSDSSSAPAGTHDSS